MKNTWLISYAFVVMCFSMSALGQEKSSDLNPAKISDTERTLNDPVNTEDQEPDEETIDTTSVEQDELTPKEGVSQDSNQDAKSIFWKSRDQIMDPKRVFTAHLGTFYNRIDGQQASTQSEGYFLSSPSFLIAGDAEVQLPFDWSALGRVGLKIYRYKQDIDPTLFDADKTMGLFEIWAGMGKRIESSKVKGPMMAKFYLGGYQDVYYFAPTFNSLTFDNAFLFAIKSDFEWIFHAWNPKRDIGAAIFAQGMAGGDFLKGGTEFGARILFTSYPIRVSYEFSASFLKTDAHKYRMLEGHVFFSYLFNL